MAGTVLPTGAETYGVGVVTVRCVPRSTGAAVSLEDPARTTCTPSADPGDADGVDDGAEEEGVDAGEGLGDTGAGWGVGLGVRLEDEVAEGDCGAGSGVAAPPDALAAPGASRARASMATPISLSLTMRRLGIRSPAARKRPRHDLQPSRRTPYN